MDNNSSSLPFWRNVELRSALTTTLMCRSHPKCAIFNVDSNSMWECNYWRECNVNVFHMPEQLRPNNDLYFFSVRKGFLFQFQFQLGCRSKFSVYLNDYLLLVFEMFSMVHLLMSGQNDVHVECCNLWIVRMKIPLIIKHYGVIFASYTKASQHRFEYLRMRSHQWDDILSTQQMNTWTAHCVIIKAPTVMPKVRHPPKRFGIGIYLARL